MPLKWEYLRKSLGGLSQDFAQPGLELTRVYFGEGFQLPPLSKQVFNTIAAKLGYPLGQLYVEKTLSPESRRAVEDMVGRVRAEFRVRLEKNHWLTAATRKQALDKLDKVKITVGYPDQCFLAWGQMWSDKARAGYLRQVTATDAHAPGGYRAYAAAQHEPGFYMAFGIRKGDPMWLDPKNRVRIW